MALGSQISRPTRQKLARNSIVVDPDTLAPSRNAAATSASTRTTACRPWRACGAHGRRRPHTCMAAANRVARLAAGRLLRFVRSERLGAFDRGACSSANAIARRGGAAPVSCTTLRLRDRTAEGGQHEADRSRRGEAMLPLSRFGSGSDVTVSVHATSAHDLRVGPVECLRRAMEQSSSRLHGGRGGTLDGGRYAG
jgi:hypothetical protein